MRKLAFLVIVFCYTSMYSMDQPGPELNQSHADLPTLIIEIVTPMAEQIVTPRAEQIDLLRFYHSDNKELNLTSLNLDDEGLRNLELSINIFVESIGVEKLIVEHSRLKTIPFSLIGFTLTNKTLKYVSFLNNNLRSSLIDTSRISASGIEPDKIDSLVAGLITSLWGNLSPQIEQVLKERNSQSTELQYYNKIIHIDKTIPPITILEAKPVPPKNERIKYILVRVGLFGLGVLITFVPSFIPWILQKGSE